MLISSQCSWTIYQLHSLVRHGCARLVRKALIDCNFSRMFAHIPHTAHKQKCQQNYVLSISRMLLEATPNPPPSLQPLELDTPSYQTVSHHSDNHSGHMRVLVLMTEEVTVCNYTQYLIEILYSMYRAPSPHGSFLNPKLN